MKDCKCETCGHSFRAKDRNPGRFCCWSCYKASRPQKQPIDCKGCGKVFTPSPKARKKQAFCSHECYLLYAKKENHSCYQTNSPQCDCRQCGDSFRVTDSARHRQFCSAKCWRLFQKSNPANGFGDCIECGTHFTRKKDGQVFCCQDCQCSRMKMENSPHWKGGSFVRYEDDVEYVHCGEWRENGTTVYRRRPRIVVANAIRRELFDDEKVWHIDRDHQNNSIENLYLFRSQSEMAKAIGCGNLPHRSNIQADSSA